MYRKKPTPRPDWNHRPPGDRPGATLGGQAWRGHLRDKLRKHSRHVHMHKPSTTENNSTIIGREDNIQTAKDFIINFSSGINIAMIYGNMYTYFHNSTEMHF